MQYLGWCRCCGVDRWWFVQSGWIWQVAATVRHVISEKPYHRASEKVGLISWHVKEKGVRVVEG